MKYMLIIVGLFVVATTITILLLSKHGKNKAGLLKRPKKVKDSDLSNEKLKSDIILSAIEDGVLLIDDQNTVQLLNPAAGVITGWQPKEAIGLEHPAVLKLINAKGEPYTPEQNPLNRVFIDKKTIRDRKANLNTQSNTVLSVDITVSPLMNSEGNVQGAVVVFRDISDQRQEEQQRTEFVSTASHEMRTPVAAIEGYLALALNEKVSKIDDKARGFLQKAHESTRHLGQLFQDLLTSAKAEDGRLTSHPAPLEISHFLEALTSDLRFAAQKKSLEVEFVLGAPNSVISTSDGNVLKPLYYVNVDQDRLREVVTNLFDNAVKYTDQGKITLGLTGDSSVVQIRVTDTGHGIASENIPHLFEKFYRVDNSSTRTVGGTGLGLFICRKIVELYNGRIWVESVVGKGSTFYINLPRLASDQALVTAHQEVAPNPAATDSKVQSKT